MNYVYDNLIPILNLLSRAMIFFSEHICKIKVKTEFACLFTYK